MPDKRTTSLAKTMRRRMTKYEYRLYAGFLSSLPVTVCRQKVIGNYIVDFLIPSAKLIIEVDGSQHYTEKGLEQDLSRDAYLQAEGYTIARYSNLDISSNLEGVADDILNRLGLL
ncbi:MAG: DUF559 domain-containing protein [Oscillospiraceae bacterium]|nr:DUF559 domain-containing protein [Oscillospiraceae bacterium]